MTTIVFDKTGTPVSYTHLDVYKRQETGTSDEGKVLNIYCWNEEFKSRLTDHYPGYTEVDATTGTLGDVTVKWNITPVSYTHLDVYKRQAKDRS